ncbi:hypothetical protein Esti_003691 [Eimeria stiedai]
MPPLPAGWAAGGRWASCMLRPTSAWRRRGAGGPPAVEGPLDARGEQLQLTAEASSACSASMVQSQQLSRFASPAQNCAGTLKRRQLERLLPTMVFEDELLDHVYLGKRVLHLHADGEEAKRLALEIEAQLTAASRGRSVADIPNKELKDLDWSLLNAVQAVSPEVSAVARYLLEAPSKRFRPLLLWLLSRALLLSAQREEGAAPRSESTPLLMVQVAELIHTASLLHDDVLDEAPTRRGRPAAHSVFGNKRAILGGDFVLARANSIAASLGSPEVCLRVSRMVESLVKGELLQALSSSSDISKAFDTMLAKSYHKTASLMAESCACVALLGGYTREWVEWAHKLGSSVGLAFQLYDDELDFLASSQALGKPANNDLKAGVITGPLLLAAQEHPGELLPLLQRRLREAGDVELAVEKIREGAALPRARLLSRVYIQHVLRLLERLPQSLPQQQDAAADIASLVLGALQRANG